jgi:hypothetical protein
VTEPKRRRLPLAVVLGLMLVGGLCALLALNTASAALEVRNRAVTDDNASSSDSEQQLLRDLAAKQAPAALAAEAKAMGLVPNPNPAFLRINANGSVNVLGSPAPATTPATPTPTPTPVAKPSSTPSANPKATPTARATATSSKSGAVASATQPGPSPSSTPAAAASPRPSSTSKNTAAPMISAPGGH